MENVSHHLGRAGRRDYGYNSVSEMLEDAMRVK
jgi:hypothetical protein